MKPDLDIEKSLSKRKPCFKEPKGPKRDQNYVMVTRSMIADDSTFHEAIQIREDNKKRKRIERAMLKKQIEEK